MASFVWTGGDGRCGSGCTSPAEASAAGRGAMRRTFEVRRETSEQPDGQDRWDQAYQLVLRWAARAAVAKEGAADASGVVRARVHRPPATRPDHRAASDPAACLGRGPRRVDRPRGAHLPR